MATWLGVCLGVLCFGCDDSGPAVAPAVGQTFPQLVRALKSDDVELRRGAALAFRDRLDAHRAAAELMHALASDNDPLVRRNAALAMDAVTGKEGTRALRRALKEDKSEAVRAAAAEILFIQQCSELHDLPFSCMLDALNDPSIRVKVRALAAICKRMHDPWSDSRAKGRILRKRLEQAKEPPTRALLALAIGEESHPDFDKAIPLLLSVLRMEERDPMPRSATDRADLCTAVFSMFTSSGRVPKAAIPQLLNGLSGLQAMPSGPRDLDLAVQRVEAVVQSLNCTGKPAAPELIEALKDKNPVVRTSAAMALAAIDPSVKGLVPVLLDSLRGPCWGEYTSFGPYRAYEVFRADENALAECGRHAAAKLIAALGDDSLRPSAIRALGMMHEDAGTVVPILVKALKHKEAKTRSGAAEALGEMAGIALTGLPLSRGLSTLTLARIAASPVAPLSLLENGLSEDLYWVRRTEAMETACQEVGKAVAPLALAHMDEEAQVREAAGVTLNAAEHACGVPLDARILAVLPKLSDDDPCVRVRVALTIRLCCPEKPEFRARLLDAVKGEDAATRGLLAFALVQDAPEIAAAIPILLRAVDRKSGVSAFDISCLLGSDDTVRERNYPRLVQALKSDDVKLRRAAPLVLAESNDSAEQAAADLMHALRADKDALVRRNAALALEHVWTEERILALCKALKEDKSEAVRAGAAEVLFVRELFGGAPEFSCMLDALDDASVRVKVRALSAICDTIDHDLTEEAEKRRGERQGPAQTPDRANLRAVRERLKAEKDPGTRGLLALALKEKNHPDMAKAVPLLAAALRMEEQEPIPRSETSRDDFRTEAFFMLGRAGAAAKTAIPELLNGLSELETLPGGEVRADVPSRRVQALMWSLVAIGKPAVPELTEALKHKNPAVRTVAAMALARIDPAVKRVVPVLLESLRGPCWGQCISGGWDFLREDECALAASGRHAAPALIEALPDDRLRQGGLLRQNSAEKALGMMGEDAQAVVPMLVEALRHKREEMRRAAASALGNMGARARDATAALEAAQKDRSKWVRESAASAKESIQRELQRKE